MKKTAILFAFAALVGCNEASEKKETTTETTTTAPADSAATASTTTTTEAPAPPMDSAAMMKAMADYMTPGEMHKWMASQNGKWDADVTSYWEGQAMPSKAVMENRMVLGGRYQQSSFKGTMNGMPFEGMGTTGYDNAKKMFVSTWVDNMGTGVITMEGNYDQGSKTLNLKGKCTDPSTGKDCDMREVMTMVDDKHTNFEMYMTMGGKEQKVMEAKYTKK